MLRLQAFGSLQLTRDGVRVAGGAAQRKRLAVLAALAALPRTGMSREKLAALFWPESDRTRSRNALYQVVASLRRDLGNDVILAGSTGDLTLNRERIASDVADFREAIAARVPEVAIAVYAGPFLDGVYLRDSDEFERWADELRSACHGEYCGALRDLAKRETAAGDHAAAAVWLRRLAIADAMSASVAVQLMGALAASGEREAAIRHGREHAEHVRAELGCAPDPRIAVLIAELQTANASIEVPRPADRVLPPELASVSAPHVLGTDAVPAAGPMEPASRGGNRDDAHDVVPDVAQPAVDGERQPIASVVPTVAVSPSAVRPRWRPSRAVTMAGLAVVTAIAMVALIRQTRTASATPSALDQRRVVVADFENRTGDSTYNLLGSTLADWVTRGVIESGLTTVSDPLSRIALPGMRKTATRDGDGDGATLARAAGAGLVVHGAIARQGQQLVITTRITAYPSQQVVFSLQPILTPDNDPLGQANELRDRIAGALAVAVDRRVSSITIPSSRTPTYAAYQQFVLGLQRFSHDEMGSIPFFERASAVDTTFALPLVWASFAYGNSGRFAQRDSVIRLLSRRPPPPGTLEALQLQDALAKDPEEKLQIRLRGAQRSPGSTWSQLAGVALHDRNRMREAARFFEQVDVERSWARGWLPYWLYFSRTLHAVGDYDGENRSADRALVIDAGNTSLEFIKLRALAGLSRTAELQKRMRTFVTAVEFRGCAETPAVYEAVVLEMRVHGDTTAAVMAMRSWIALCERELAERADSLTPRRRLSLGLALYRADRLDSAQRVLAQVSGPLPLVVSGEVVLRGRLGRIAARQGDRAEAERQMRAIRSGGEGASGNAVMECAAIAALLGDRVEAFRALEFASTKLPYYFFHRDRDYANLWSYPPFVALATPR